MTDLREHGKAEARARRVSAAIVLAAGEGVRMRSATPKVLHTLCGRTMLGHVLDAVTSLEPDTTIVVVGHGRERITAALAGTSVIAAVQEEQRGTGHAVRVALEAAPEVTGTVVVALGDAPQLTSDMLASLVAEHETSKSAATALSFLAADPTGYGRIVRNDAGEVARIVEHRDATEDERAIRECNALVFAFDAEPLRSALTQLSANNAQGEEYLNGVIDIFLAEGRKVSAVEVEGLTACGVNDRAQLAKARRELNQRIVGKWMRAGVSVIDPATTWIEVDVVLDDDVTLHPNTALQGNTRVGGGAEIGPDCILRNTAVGKGARVIGSRCDNVEIGPDLVVGPGCALRG